MGPLSVSQDKCVRESEGHSTTFLMEPVSAVTGVGSGYLPCIPESCPHLLSSKRSHFQNLKLTVSLQVISMVMVAVGVYARMTKHAGRPWVSLCLPIHAPAPVLAQG